MEKINGSAANGAQQVTVSPVDAARYALQFLQRVSMMPSERGSFAVAESLLQGIASGQIAITTPTVGAELAETERTTGRLPLEPG